MANKKKNPHYVNNKEFLAAMIEYRAAVQEAEDQDESRPVVPTYIADCIMKIAYHLSYKPNFVNYTFREEMICDGIENCLQYIDNFNPDKSNNPFAYFTQIIYYAFLRRIQKEKKYLYTKYKATEHANMFIGTSDVQEHDSGADFNDSIKQSEWSEEYMSNFIENFEEHKRKKKKRKVIAEDL
jgi:hypothetical protein